MAKMSIGVFAAHMEKVTSARLWKELKKAETATLKDALTVAIKQSSGGYSQGQLDAMGNPYGHLRPHPLDPAIINAQTGVFRASWLTEGPSRQGMALRSRLFNTDPKSRFLLGTKKMIPRPVALAVLKQIKGRRVARIKAAVNAAFQPQ